MVHEVVITPGQDADLRSSGDFLVTQHASRAARRSGHLIWVACLLLICSCLLVPRGAGADIASNSVATLSEDSAAAIAALKDFLATDHGSRPTLAEQPFAHRALTR
jgi:hypothetical protein